MCAPAVAKCNLEGTDAACALASDVCTIGSAIKAVAPSFYTYDVRQPNGAVWPEGPSTNFSSYLNRQDIMDRIGAHSPVAFTKCINAAGFGDTGDGELTALPGSPGREKSGSDPLANKGLQKRARKFRLLLKWSSPASRC